MQRFPPHLDPLPRTAGERKHPSSLSQEEEVYQPQAAPEATRGQGEGLSRLLP